MLSLLLAGSAALAQQDDAGAPTKLGATSFTTPNGTVVVNFTTEDRDEFYELLTRIGSTDRWEYSVSWRPHCLLSVYVTKDSDLQTELSAVDALLEIVESLNMHADSPSGRTGVSFIGERTRALAVRADGEYFTLSAENVPSLVVLACAAESQGLSYTVANVASLTVPKIEFDRLKADDFWGFWARMSHIEITRWSRFVQVARQGPR
ncbi:MAG: hypothetical protein IH945_12070 [Armatimonadetes bacterium]|nr:hypothetical protein [Armatimonadota bacterium]